MGTKEMRAISLRNGIRRAALRLFLAAACATTLSAVTVDFQVADLGQNVYRLSYLISGIQILIDQEVDIRFDPALYGLLSSAVAPPGFDLLLLQPDNPPGTFGDYSALALMDNPPLSTPFEVNVHFLGMGRPGTQPFFINQLDAAGNIASVVTQGNTEAPGGTALPEPAAWAFGLIGILTCVVLGILRRRAA
jgi:hypothetical protein